MATSGQPEIGNHVIYVDKHGVPHSALVTNEFGDPKNRAEEFSVNLLYVNPDEGQGDQYGRQILRESSVPPKRFQSAHGNYWQWPE